MVSTFTPLLSRQERYITDYDLLDTLCTTPTRLALPYYYILMVWVSGVKCREVVVIVE